MHASFRRPDGAARVPTSGVFSRIPTATLPQARSTLETSLSLREAATRGHPVEVEVELSSNVALDDCEIAREIFAPSPSTRNSMAS